MACAGGDGRGGVGAADLRCADTGHAPLQMASDHPSGRCRYHGGVSDVGPPSGNENARIHGLYARRLQRCGPQCPLWNSCAYAGKDVAGLDPKDRPICAYERDEYAALVKHYFMEELDPPKDAEDEIEEETENNVDDPRIAALLRRAALNKGSESECPEPFLLHQLVLLTILQTRAAAVLSEVTLTEAVEVDTPGYKMKTAKPGAVLEAFLRIAREYRALHAAIDTKKLIPKPKSMGLGSRLAPLMLKARGILKECIVDLDSPEYQKENADRTEAGAANTEENPETGNGAPDIGNDARGAAGEASGDVVNGEAANREVAAGEADRVGEIADGESDVASGEITGTVSEPGSLGREEPARPPAVRPPPLLWSDVEARRSRSRSPNHDYLSGDRGW